MARTTINSLGIPADTIVSADLDYPLTDFSSTGIDDNASATALTIDSSGNISVTGTVDGRDLATDGTKLDGIAASATNYGDSDVATYISGDRTYGNITTTGYIAGPSTFTIDPAAVGDNTGTLVIAGNLQVDGTTTTINSTTMTVDDLNITLASGAANAAAANGAGITVDGASATLTYNGTNDDWNFNKTLNVSETNTTASNRQTPVDVLEIQAYYDGGDGQPFGGAGAASFGSGLIFSNEKYVNSNLTKSAAIYGLVSENSTDTTGGGQLAFYTASTLDASLTEKMRILPNGDVGIGTAIPSYKFVVSNNGEEGLEIDPVNVDGTIRVFAYDRTTTSYIAAQWFADSHSWTAGGSSTWMELDSTGNLNLNGNLHAGRGNDVSMSASADGMIQIDGNAYTGAITMDATAMYLYHNSATRNLVLATNETAQLTLDYNGNVQLNRGSLLVHDSNGSIDNALRLAYNGTSGQGDINVRSTGGDTYLRILTSNAGTTGEVARFTHDGNVGIGGIIPESKLHVATGTKNNTPVKIEGYISNTNGSAYDSYQELKFAGSGSDGSSAGIRHHANIWNDGNSALSFWTSQHGGSYAERMRINGAGYVGFANTNPAARLDIQTPSYATSTTDGMIKFNDSVNGQHTAIQSYHVGGQGSDINIGTNMYVNTSGSFSRWTGSYGAAGATFYRQGIVAFNTNGTSGVAIERMRINADGKVQIGTTLTPAYTLEVAGTNNMNFRIMPNFQQTGIIRIGRSDNTNRWHDIVAYNDSTQNANYIAFDVHNGTVSSTYRAARIQGDGTIKAGGGLQAQLQRATLNVGVINNNRMPVGHYTPGETVFEIDPTWSAQQLQDYFNLTSSQCDWVEDSTAPGGYAIKITGNRSVGGNYASGFPYIPVDQDDIYYMECWIKNTGGGVTGHYMGSIDYSHTFASLGGNPGSFGYWVMSNYTTNSSSGWVKVSGYITGFGNNVGQFESGTKYWTPQALFNYRLDSGSRECYISGWKVIKVRSPGNRVFANNVTVQGTLSKTSGSFKIDHPLPSMANTHHLVHSFIEGPRADLIYSDTIQLTNGAATVNLDEYATMTEGTFEALCKSVRCFTSNEDNWDAVKGSVSGNILTIECQNASSNAQVSWIVIGERKDPSIIAADWTDDSGRVIVEPEKIAEVLNAEYLEAPTPELGEVNAEEEG